MRKPAYVPLRVVGFAATALLMELLVLTDVGGEGVRPDLLLPFVCFAALFASDRAQALGTAWILGALRDTTSAGPLGLYALIYLALAWAMAEVRLLIFREHPLVQALLAGGSAGITALAAAAWSAAFAGGVPFLTVLLRTSIGAALTALAAPPVLFLLTRRRALVRP
ncbi:MAG: rod shape-determining protein MreD [Planctomycetes bacterium]|nr:rod shape-determining protein MreD [Planctomycetota bacterium]